MARLPARVDWITHKRTQTKVALRLDKSSMTFQAKWADKTYRDKDGAALRKQILGLIEASEHLSFHPVIQIEVMRPGGQFGSGRKVDISMRLGRFYYADSDSGLLKLGWESRGNKHRIKHWNPGKHFTGLPCHVPHCYSYDSDHYYLAYSEDLWAGLAVLLDCIEQAKARVIQLLSADDIVPRLEAVGVEFIKALPAPKEEM